MTELAINQMFDIFEEFFQLLQIFYVGVITISKKIKMNSLCACDIFILVKLLEDNISISKLIWRIYCVLMNNSFD